MSTSGTKAEKKFLTSIYEDEPDLLKAMSDLTDEQWENFESVKLNKESDYVLTTRNPKYSPKEKKESAEPKWEETEVFADQLPNYIEKLGKELTKVDSIKQNPKQSDVFVVRKALNAEPAKKKQKKSA
jgi:hypothetical protein